MSMEIYNVAFVDDEEILINEISEFLKDVPYLNIKGYTNPKTLLKDFSNFQPQIILSDLMMPEMSGIELLKIVKEKNQNIEFIIMTGYADMDSAIKALQLRASNFLLKPVRLPLLLEYINRSIEYLKTNNLSVIAH
jgi:DNA-binding NtrC family response regulator